MSAECTCEWRGRHHNPDDPRCDLNIAAVGLRVQTETSDAAKVITLCGSTKFKDAINAENFRLTVAGNVVISLGLFGHTDLPDYNWDTDVTDLKTSLDKLHFQKIRMADEVHVVDVGGYYGESTAREIAYARSLGKPVTFMSEVDSEILAAVGVQTEPDTTTREAEIADLATYDDGWNGDGSLGPSELVLRNVRSLSDLIPLSWESTLNENGTISFERLGDEYASIEIGNTRFAAIVGIGEERVYINATITRPSPLSPKEGHKES